MQRTRILTALLLSLIASFSLKAGLFKVPTASAAPYALIQSANRTTPTPTPEAVTRGRPPLSLTLCLLGFCLIFLLLIGVVVLGFIARRPASSKDKNE